MGHDVPVDDPASSIRSIADAPGTSDPEPFAGPDHPIRKLTRQVAFDGAWDGVRARKMAALFDSMAADWAADHVDATKAAPILDAAERSGLAGSGRWLELGSGTGAGTRVLSDRVETLFAFDLSRAMLAHAPGDLAPRVQGDASMLPFADATFDVVVMVNMVLFPHEVDRVLSPGGAMLWINTLGDQTPIHLPVEDVVRAMPGSWSATTARAGTGFWAALQRSG